MSPFDGARMTSYWRSIVTMCLSHVVSRILNVVKYRDLEIPVKVNQGNWKWYHSIDCVWFPYSKFFPKTHRFSDIRLVSVQWLWNPGLMVTQGHRNQHVSIRHLWLPLNVLWQLYGPISYRFRDKRRFQSKIANGPVYFAPPMKGYSWNWVSALRGQKLELWCYRAKKDVWWYLQPSGYNTVHERGGQTDGRTDTGRQQRPR